MLCSLQPQSISTQICHQLGDPLAQVQREAESSLEFARKIRFGFAIDVITVQLDLIRTLRGLTDRVRPL